MPHPCNVNQNNLQSKLNVDDRKDVLPNPINQCQKRSLPGSAASSIHADASIRKVDTPAITAASKPKLEHPVQLAPKTKTSAYVNPYNGYNESYEFIPLTKKKYRKSTSGKRSSKTSENDSTRLNNIRKMENAYVHDIDDAIYSETGDSRNFKERWDINLQHLTNFKNQFGHTNVPRSFKVDGKLAMGEWVKLQRKLYRKKQNGENVPLSDERVRRLDAIEFNWNAEGKKANFDIDQQIFNKEEWEKVEDTIDEDDSPKDKQQQSGNSYREAAWDTQFKNLEKYKDDNGHCDVPISEPMLGEWVKTQRRRYKEHVRDGRNMSPGRIEKLNSIGFNFTVHNNSTRTTLQSSSELEDKRKSKRKSPSPAQEKAPKRQEIDISQFIRNPLAILPQVPPAGTIDSASASKSAPEAPPKTTPTSIPSQPTERIPSSGTKKEKNESPKDNDCAAPLENSFEEVQSPKTVNEDEILSLEREVRELRTEIAEIKSYASRILRLLEQQGACTQHTV